MRKPYLLIPLIALIFYNRNTDKDNDTSSHIFDVVVANYDQTNRIYYGNGDGTFIAGANISDDANYSRDINAGNFD